MSDSFEKIIEDYILTRTTGFCLDEAFVAIRDKLGQSYDRLRREIENQLDDCRMVFRRDDIFLPRQCFFAGAEFAVQPTEDEIEDGFLIPGHRFAVFRHESVFPASVIIHPGSREAPPVRTVETKMKLRDAVSHCILLGAEDMFDDFIADHAANAEILGAGKPDGEIIMTVFDVKDFFRRERVGEDSRLIFKVLDWLRGEFSVRVDNKQVESAEWKYRFGRGLMEAVGQMEAFADIEEQLSRAAFNCGAEFWRSPPASIESAVRDCERIEMVADGGMSSLTVLAEDDGETEIPAGIGVGAGQATDLDGLLSEMGYDLGSTEVEAFMLDELFNGGGNLAAVMERCFGAEPLEFLDAVQEAMFLNHIEMRWEDVVERYDRDRDIRNGPVRERVLELIEERLVWERNRGADSSAPRELGHCSEKLSRLLEFLAAPEGVPADIDLDEVMEAVETVAEVQRSLIDSPGV